MTGSGTNLVGTKCMCAICNWPNLYFLSGGNVGDRQRQLTIDHRALRREYGLHGCHYAAWHELSSSLDAIADHAMALTFS